MPSQLITATEVAELPDGPEGFLAFETICSNRLSDRLQSDEADRVDRATYASSVAAAADEYGVDPGGALALGNFTTEWNGQVATDFEAFELAVRGIVTKVQIQVGRAARAGALTLSQTDQTRIEHLVEALRSRIASEPTLDEARRKVLNKKLDELLSNLKSKKVDLARTMVIVGAFFVALDQAQAATIKLPETIASIAKLVTLAKDYQDSLLPAPPAPPKQITDQSTPTTQARSAEQFSADLDDEIPF